MIGNAKDDELTILMFAGIIFNTHIMMGRGREGAWASSRGAKRRGDLFRLPRVVPTLAMTSEIATATPRNDG